MTTPGTNYLLLLEAIKTVGLCAHDLEKTHRNIPELVEHKECVGKAVTVCLYLIDMMKSKVPPEQQTKIDRVAATFDLSPKMKVLSIKEISDIRKQFCTRKLRDHMIEELLDENKDLRKSLASLKNDNSSLLELEKEEREWLRERMGNLENNIQWMKINIDKVQFDTNKVIENYEAQNKHNVKTYQEYETFIDSFENHYKTILRQENNEKISALSAVAQIEATNKIFEQKTNSRGISNGEELGHDIQLREELEALKEKATRQDNTIENLTRENKVCKQFRQELERLLKIKTSDITTPFQIRAEEDVKYVEASIELVEEDILALKKILPMGPHNYMEREAIERFITLDYLQLEIYKKKLETHKKEEMRSIIELHSKILEEVKRRVIL